VRRVNCYENDEIQNKTMGFISRSFRVMRMEVTDYDEIYREVLQSADTFYEEVFEGAVW
jgi:hypothetical protein